MNHNDINARIRSILAVVLERDPTQVAALPDDTPLFGSGLSLDSLTGLELLTAVRQEFGVDVAAEDYNLDSLRTIGTLVNYLSQTMDDGRQTS